MAELKNIKLSENNNIKVHGRTIDSRDPAILMWSGASIEMNVKCSELSVLVEAPFNGFECYIAIEINGEILQRLMLTGEKQWIPVFRGMNPDNITNVRIIKDMQVMFCDEKHCLNVYEVRLDGEILHVENKKYKLEFIGDSITTGEGAVGAHKELDWISQFFSHVRSYPYMLSKKLNADYQIFSQSGFGLCHSWDNHPEKTIPMYYEDICSIIPDGELKNKGFNNKYDFSNWQPDAIIINLGTNDDVAFDNPEFVDPDTGIVHKFRKDGDILNIEDLEIIKKGCYDFLSLIRKNNPNSLIILGFGMLGFRIGNILKDSVDKYNKDNNDNVIFVKLPEAIEEDDFGSRLHPGIKTHKKSVDILYDLLKEKLS